MSTTAPPAGGGPPVTQPDRLIHQTSPLVQDLVNCLSTLLDTNDFSDATAVYELITTCRDQLRHSLTADNHLEGHHALLAENNRLTTENTQLVARVADLDASNDNNIEALMAMTNDRDTFRRMALNLSTQSSSSKIMDPERFSGDKSKFRTSLTQLRLHVTDIPDVQRKLRFAINLLTGPAALHFNRYVTNDHVNLPSFANFVQKIEGIYSDSDRKAVAEEALYHLKQGPRTFTEYLT